MNSIEIRPDDITPLDAIAAGVVGVRVLFVNAFGVAQGDHWTLIDAGLPGSARRIQVWAARHFGSAPPNAIVLTHGHFDHVGAVADLLEKWDVPVYAHIEEHPYLNGQRSYPPPDPSVGGGMMTRMSFLYPRSPINISGRLHALPEGGALPFMPGWRWIHTPGHTPGHVSLFRDQDRMLIAGDAFCTTKPESAYASITQKPELHGPPAYFTTDWVAARRSVQHLALLRPNFVAPGHGRPTSDESAARALEVLADRFEEIAVPARGRYVSRPLRG